MFGPFATVVLTMIVLLWPHFADKLKHLSSANQYACSTSILIYPWALPLGISIISQELHNFLWVLHRTTIDHQFQYPWVLSGCLVEDTDSWIESALWFNNSYWSLVLTSLYSIMSFTADCLHHHRHAKAWPCYLCPSSLEYYPNSTLSYIEISTSYCWSWKATLILSLQSYLWFRQPFATPFLLLDVVASRLHTHETTRQMRGDHALLFLGKYVLRILVFKHIFLSIVLFNLSCDLYNMSSNNSLLM